jgi:hypothetical protein
MAEGQYQDVHSDTERPFKALIGELCVLDRLAEMIEDIVAIRQMWPITNVHRTARTNDIHNGHAGDNEVSD